MRISQCNEETVDRVSPLVVTRFDHLRIKTIGIKSAVNGDAREADELMRIIIGGEGLHI